MNSAYSKSRYQISVQTDNLIFLDQIYPNKVFPVKTRKSEHHHGILDIWISVSTKFQLKLTIWVFCWNLPKKSTTEQNNGRTSFSHVTSAKVGISPQKFLTISLNSFYTLVYSFKAIPSPKLLNFNQEHLSKKIGFSGQNLIKLRLW